MNTEEYPTLGPGKAENLGYYRSDVGNLEYEVNVLTSEKCVIPILSAKSTNKARYASYSCKQLRKKPAGCAFRTCSLVLMHPQ
jgi:hypothetical protein